MRNADDVKGQQRLGEGKPVPLLGLLLLDRVREEST